MNTQASVAQKIRVATQKKCSTRQHYEPVWLRQADGETRTLSTSESICFTRRGSAMEPVTTHQPVQRILNPPCIPVSFHWHLM